MSSRSQTMPAARVHDETAGAGIATGFVGFAGVLMIMGGMFQVLQGLAAIIDDTFFVVTSNYAFHVDVTTWGWVHLIAGAVVTVAGFYVLSGALWARIIGILIAVASSVVNFFYIPYYPVWSMLIISLDIIIIGSLAMYNRDVAMG